MKLPSELPGDRASGRYLAAAGVDHLNIARAAPGSQILDRFALGRLVTGAPRTDALHRREDYIGPGCLRNGAGLVRSDVQVGEERLRADVDP